MPIRLNHTIVAAKRADAAANWLADLLGLPAPFRFGPFTCLPTANDVTLDFIDSAEAFETQHYAFLVDDAEFDAIYGRIVARGIPHWADPSAREPGRINRHFGGRGVYWKNPDGHYLEIITKPYGSS
jgi:catechol 2,3-dioxygenase-like lactoylglutathione lyase family enzyme